MLFASRNMEPTLKLYFRDSNLLEFSATVIDAQPSERGHSVVLDQTAFYPTGGGQPNDIGTLGEATRGDVFEDETGTIYHVVPGAGSLNRGQTGTRIIERVRRL